MSSSAGRRSSSATRPGANGWHFLRGTPCLLSGLSGSRSAPEHPTASAMERHPFRAGRQYCPSPPAESPRFATWSVGLSSASCAILFLAVLKRRIGFFVLKSGPGDEFAADCLHL